MFLFGIKLAAMISAIGMNLAPLDDIAVFSVQGHTGDKHPLPYAMIAVTCACWCFYAVLKSDYFPMLFTNGIGVTAGIFHLSAFIYYTPSITSRENVENRPKYDGRLYGAFFGVAFMVMVSIVAVKTEEEAVSLLGTLGVLSVCVLFASPLVVMADVLRSRNSKALSRPLSVLSFVCALSWTLYGYLLSDVYIWGPNSIGLLLSVVQLSLIIVYPDPSESGAASSAQNEKNGMGKAILARMAHLLEEIFAKGKRDPAVRSDVTPSRSTTDIELMRRPKSNSDSPRDSTIDGMLLNDHSVVGYAN
mmetsp:Transcript_10319/g.16648  ORF Transcript_10319/g.16648 Transcript_10319/m.16648 type:complete len:304 (-) Transcript_10319:147-1058(-)